MRRIESLVLAMALCACDGSNGEPAPAPPVSGSIMGSQFTPADRGALVLAPAPCDIPGLGTRSLAVLALGFSSFPDVCGFVTTTGLCGDVASSLIIGVNILSAPATGTAAPIGPGTYAIGVSEDGQGNILAADAGITKVDAACASAPAIPTAQAGSITITAVSPRVAGTLDVTYSDGGRLAGSFDLERCSAAVDFCTVIADSCATRPCCTTATTCP